MGAGASIKEVENVYKKESSRFHTSVKSDLDKGMAFLNDVNSFLEDEKRELKDTENLRNALRSGCDRLKDLLMTFKTDEVFDILERVSVQKRIDSNAAALHSLIHGFAGIPATGSRRRLSVKTPLMKKKLLSSKTLLPKGPSLKSVMTLPPKGPTMNLKLNHIKTVRSIRNPKMKELMRLVRKIKDADYDVDMYAANKLTAGCALPFIGIHIFQSSTYLQQYDIEIEVLEHFLEKIHVGYSFHKNPYVLLLCCYSIFLPLSHFLFYFRFIYASHSHTYFISNIQISQLDSRCGRHVHSIYVLQT